MGGSPSGADGILRVWWLHSRDAASAGFLTAAHALRCRRSARWRRVRRLLFQVAGLIAQRRLPRLVLVARGRLLELSAGLVQLRLRQLDDRAQTEVVALLREIERVGALGEQLVGEVDALIGSLDVEQR